MTTLLCVLALTASLTAPTLAAAATDEEAAANATTDLDPELEAELGRAIDLGITYLRGQQADDGAWSDSVGVTALALRAQLESPQAMPGDDPMIEKGVAFILKHVNDDGSISETNHNRNYNTAVAMTTLAATGEPKYEAVIADAQRFLQGLQLDEADGYEPSHNYYGGIGYGGDERPDLSNLYMALEAMKATDLDPDDPLWDKALTFVTRSQNNSETNDIEVSVDDGGFAYMPNYSPHGEGRSYGGMTSAGLLSLLFAGVDKTDPRVQAAYDWIRANYTVETNPNATGKQGLFYYYNAFAKAMAAYGEPLVTDTDGVSHDWRRDLGKRLLALQDADGSWVNKDSSRWWEGDPNLVTSWSLIALNHIHGR
ncbi:hypothetical protein CKO40_00110 [Halochromatium glycolicum]|jgi:squalene-hopene/tetraprenyl-beta-curcumene cyclase|uniref:Squalene cyclase C-terminal domain-containing protein n=2 Tax=Halochromatium glycolicum TaxID=85075 RepID=A0AAJ0X7C8_9GAMM|nr:hypothetical protein [Halochromatium glycolicum]